MVDGENAEVMSALRKRTLAVARSEGRGVVLFWLLRKVWIQVVEGSMLRMVWRWERMVEGVTVACGLFIVGT